MLLRREFMKLAGALAIIPRGILEKSAPPPAVEPAEPARQSEDRDCGEDSDVWKVYIDGQRVGPVLSCVFESKMPNCFQIKGTSTSDMFPVDVIEMAIVGCNEGNLEIILGGRLRVLTIQSGNTRYSAVARLKGTDFFGRHRNSTEVGVLQVRFSVSNFREYYVEE
ncbi:MAG: hypothetical protein KOO60_07310 [Gemmatimonadales bacterium]|nr:hypothetical protein [Gemmatimonadales bacterium]